MSKFEAARLVISTAQIGRRKVFVENASDQYPQYGFGYAKDIEVLNESNEPDICGRSKASEKMYEELMNSRGSSYKRT